MALHTPFAWNIPSAISVLMGKFTTHSFNIQCWIHLCSDVFTNSPFCGAPSHPHIPIPGPSCDSYTLVPVHGTCHMIPGQQFYPVPFWTALTQLGHLMTVYWLKEWMMKKFNLSSWVWPDKMCLLKNKILTERPKTIMVPINIILTHWWPSSSSDIFNLHVKSKYLALEEKDSNILHKLATKIAQGLLSQGTCIHS